MSLTLVSIPIGNPDDITLRAIEVLKNCDVVLGEEFSVTKPLLKRLGVENKEVFRLNEHTDPEELREFAQICSEKKVALISDCGTPGFCDPGNDLVGLLRKKNISVTAAPGASSLMVLLSLSSRKLSNFVFEGFLPVDKDERQKAVVRVSKEKRPMVLMDTPYRLERLLSELAQVMPQRIGLLGLNLTSAEEVVLEESLQNLQKKVVGKKAEFVLLVYGI